VIRFLDKAKVCGQDTLERAADPCSQREPRAQISDTVRALNDYAETAFRRSLAQRERLDEDTSEWERSCTARPTCILLEQVTCTRRPTRGGINLEAKGPRQEA